MELDTAYIKVGKIKLIEHTLEKIRQAYLKTFGILNGGVIQAFERYFTQRQPKY